MMRKSTLNFIVDLVALLAILVMVATGLVIRYVLPPGTGGRHGEGGLALWGLGRHDWGDVHFWASVALTVLLILHVALHWSWVCSTLKRLLGGNTSESAGQPRDDIYGVGFFVAVVLLFGGFVWYGQSAVERIPAGGHEAASPREHGEATTERGHGDGHNEIKGSMTLAEVAGVAGISVETLAAELGLDASVSPDARIGPLAREQGFGMSKVREVVAGHTGAPNH